MGINLKSQMTGQLKWLFPDQHFDKMTAVLIKAEERTSQNGNKFPVFIFESAGIQYLLSAWRTVYSTVEEKLGDDTDKWIGKTFNISNKNNTISLELTEEKINE